MKSTLSGLVKSVGDALASAADAASTAATTSFTAAKDSAERAGHSALEFGKSTGEAMGNAAQATSNFAARAGDSISGSAGKSLAVVKHGVVVAGESASSGAKSAGAALGVAADTAGNALGALGVLVGDLNGDGKVDFEDAKIAAAKVREVAGAAAAELGQLGKSALQSRLVQDAAAGAALGAYKSIGKK